MCLKEEVDGFSFMPAGSIQIKPDRISPKSSVEMSQNLHESLAVSSLCSNHPEAPQKRRHPARQIKTVLVLARRRDAIGMSSLDPPPSQSGMQRKSRLILKNHRLPRPQILKFFLTSGGIASPLPPGLEDRNNWPVLADIPIDASISETAAPSSSAHIGASGVRPALGPSHRARFNPKSCGDCSKCLSTSWAIWGVNRDGRPGIVFLFRAFNPSKFTARIQRFKLIRVKPRTWAVHPGRCPSTINRSAAIFNPCPAPGRSLAKATRLSRVTSGCRISTGSIPTV